VLGLQKSSVKTGDREGMHTITLTISDDVRDRFLWLLSHFLPEEVVVNSDSQSIVCSDLTSGQKMTHFLQQQPPLDWSNIGDPIAWQKQQRNDASPWEML